MPESNLLRLVQEHGEPSALFAIHYEGPFGAGMEQFSGWLIGLSMITNYHEQTLPAGVGAVVALFLTEHGKVVVTYDRGLVTRPQDRDRGWTLGERVRWLGVCEDLGEALPMLADRAAESVAVSRAYLEIINMQADWARRAS